MSTDVERPVLRGCTMANALLMLACARAEDWEACRYFLRELCERRGCAPGHITVATRDLSVDAPHFDDPVHREDADP